MSIYNTIIGGSNPAKDCNATAADILSGKTAAVGKEVITGSMINRSTINNDGIGVSSTYPTIPANPNDTNAQLLVNTDGISRLIVQPPRGYYDGGVYASVTASKVASITGLTANKLAKGQTVLGVAGNYTSDATATANDIASGKTAYVNGNKITGTGTNFEEIITKSYSVDDSLDSYGWIKNGNEEHSLYRLTMNAYSSIYGENRGSLPSIGIASTQGINYSQNSDGKVTGCIVPISFEITSWKSLLTLEEANNSGYTLLNASNLNYNFKDLVYGTIDYKSSSISGSSSTHATNFRNSVSFLPTIYARYSQQTLVEQQGIPAYRNSAGKYYIKMQIEYTLKFAKWY